ncbi:PREDICTED: G-type lectin S-receptor-like serine/threonine-protein kinase At4g27290 [Populus euphratica]|uniref:Receptor-like serine/threonine-protein kinase n=1 Tax=Populus euphratica TaxID=75702 RepID=A0AAJ6XTR1_POPEU|nr:PREDICTED: G-type lectin S-receptor-like serine/threonine-protein kinase At4g27290 [Populus euphratica]
MAYIPILLFGSSILLVLETATGIDTINTAQYIRDGDTITSAEGTYVLGFFSPGKSRNRYLGIWYGKISVQTVVWVANTEIPLNDLSGVLRLTDEGILVLLNRSGSVVWSSSTSTPVRNPVARLLDSGNLVLKEKGDNNLENTLWQSFQHPGNTLLPEMKLGRNKVTGMDWYLTAWKSPDDPSKGNVTCKLVPYGYTEILVMEKSKVLYRSGPWNGLRFSGMPSLKPNPIYKFEFVSNEEEVYYREHLTNNSTHWRVVQSQNGDIHNFKWIEKKQSWLLYGAPKTDYCDRYALCGLNGICNINNSPICDCLNGFIPNVSRDWNMMDWSKGCVRKTPLNSYSNLDIRDGGSGCLLWFGDLIDIRILHENDIDVYIRMAESELGALERSSRKKHMKEDLDLPLFDLDIVACATNNFSADNKLGEGGFGPVYKGALKDGREIAVKRLSKNSRQGLDEFKNEVKHIVKLQHRNLVKLLGCSIEEDEMILIYEFCPNKSLDFFIFDEKHRLLLDWPMRYNIINGIARGLLYLHQDSRLRVIHRDLKADNILLDYELNPKISDFGLARSLGGNEIEANTNKVVGTYGYISPEYANFGLYSLKSDVFGFGVLMLEIVSGNRNRGFRHPDHHMNLLGHAWRLFMEGRPLELAAESIAITCYSYEVLRSIHVALLCVQDKPEDRPNMSCAVLMLGNNDALPQPKHPGFFTERDLFEASYSSSMSKPSSANECSISVLEAR